MSIWGHSEVYVEKSAETRTWLVYTAREPRQLLCEVRWADAFRNLNRAQYPDYLTALATCQLSDVTALTPAEEEIAKAEARGEVPVKKEEAEAEPPPNNVVPLRRRR